VFVLDIQQMSNDWIHSIMSSIKSGEAVAMACATGGKNTVSVGGRTYTGESVKFSNGRWIVDGKDVTDDENGSSGGGGGGGGGDAVSAAAPRQVSNPTDLKDAIRLIEDVRLHDRAKFVTDKWADYFIGANSEQFVSVVDSCYLHDRAGVIIDYILKKPLVFETFSSRDWVSLLETVNLHDRLKVVLAICSTLEGAAITDAAVELVYMHDQRKAQEAVTRLRVQNAMWRPPARLLAAPPARALMPAPPCRT
jgi:hypothetical protein